jgi:hypothetical protein
MTTQYVFEKMSGKRRWQARINGEFVCYVDQTPDGQFYCDGLGWIVYGESKSGVVDNVMEAIGE